MSNILLDENLRAFLTDFGLAFPSRDMYLADGFLGTVPFMAPEIFSMEYAHAETSMARDIWAVGVILFYLLKRKFPECSVASDVVETGGQMIFICRVKNVRQFLFKIPAHHSAWKLLKKNPFGPDTPKHPLVDPLIKKMLAFYPGACPSAENVLIALNDLLDSPPRCTIA